MSLEELQRIRDQYMLDLADLEKELNIVEASISNPEQTQLLKNLQNHEVLPKHIQKLLDVQSKKDKNNTEETDNRKLVSLYQTLTGIHINKISVEYVHEKSSYFYYILANTGNLDFTINYCSNKAPDGYVINKEIINELTIILSKSSLQKEVQEGLDFFSKHPIYFSNLILFLKTVSELNVIRKNICKSLLLKHTDNLQIALSESTGQMHLVFKGIVYPLDYVIIAWQIKWDSKSCNARDSFNIESNLTGDTLLSNINPIFKNMCKYSYWTGLSANEKFNLIDSAICFLKEAVNSNVSE